MNLSVWTGPFAGRQWDRRLCCGAQARTGFWHLVLSEHRHHQSTYSYWPMSWDGMGCSAVTLICFPPLPNWLWNYLWCRCCFQSFQPPHNHTVFSFPHHTTLDGRSICHLICSDHKSWKWTLKQSCFSSFIYWQLSLTSSYVAVPLHCPLM